MDRYWESLLLAMVGDQFDSLPSSNGHTPKPIGVESETLELRSIGQGLCGAVVSIRSNEDILSLWNGDASSVEILAKTK